VLNATHGEAQAVLEHQPEDKHGPACPLVRGTFVMGWFARELNEINFIGPLGFYMSAQGSLIIYVAIIWYYAHYMNNLDKEYGVHEGELD
jgi:putative solute:sodium symporter small subunit